MPDFQPYTLDLAACRVQVGELKAFLGTSPALGEKALRKFLLPRTHLPALVGLYNPSLARPDRLAWE